MKRTVLPGLVATALVAASASLVALAPAGASTTVTPTEAGDPPVVRDSSVTVDVDRTAMTYYRSGATGAFTPQGGVAVALGVTACRGDLPTGTNSSPRTTLTVTGPDGSTLVDALSPVRDMSLAGFTTRPTNQPKDAAPAAANFRGDLPDAGAHHGLSRTLDLTGRPAGTYTVTTTHTNKVKTGLFGACTTGTPVSNGAGGFTSAAPTPGPVVETSTFEYRPWQATFVDVLGKGKVSANVTPAEFTFSIGAKKAKVYENGPGNDQTFYAIPGGGFALPNDPTECAEDAASCLPPTAVPCDPAAGCEPRVMIIDKVEVPGDRDSLMGVFDIKTKAFVALAKVDGSQRTLFSVGTENDKIYQDLLKQLGDGAAAQGIDLASILATEVRVGDGTRRTSLSLLNGLQIDPSASPAGVQIASGSSAQAGIVLHVHSSLRLSGGACVANSASSTSSPARFTRAEDNGYTVSRSDVLPKVPAVGPLGPITGGPLFLVKGTFKADALVNTASAVVGADTAVDEPNGYPVWVNPFISGGRVETPRTMEFLGTGTWSASETPVGAGCLVVDFLLGTGVAVFDNPLPVGLGTVFDPLATPSPEAEKLTDALTGAVEQVTSQVASNPVVGDLLDQLVGSLPLA